ncbi:HNH endonuclease [Grimontia sp. SpTr1]|uniref:HNH endonuclease n=1 Tax=Grimontia sp. SpTr1 TaxID=2995319 RepID=UPI00248B7FF6|nr:HNH endonuclease [Grimontia sp. SpTr1]
MIENFNTICQFRQDNPPTPGQGIKTNNPIVQPVKSALVGLRDELEAKFKDYRGFKFRFQESRGATLFPFVTHVSILPEGQDVSNGVYVVLCFDKFGRGALVGCAESKSNPKGIGTVKRKFRGKPLAIDVDGSSQNTRYNDVYANPREFFYPLNSDSQLITHLTASLDRTLVILGKLKESDVAGNIDAIEEEEYTPANNKDGRERILRQIVARQGQRKFRESLLAEYNSTCVVTGCNVIQALEAAHIIPYNGEETNHVQNGLLLRSDIHTLFDLGLISIDAKTMKVVISDQLQGSEYQSLAGKDVSGISASKACLDDHLSKVFVGSN